jgi:hypothetical protein
MKSFTDLLDEYLEADKELKEARERYKGYDFDYFHYKLVHAHRHQEARAALNQAFAKAMGGSMSTKHTPAEALESLVRDLNATNWSSWQSIMEVNRDAAAELCRLHSVNAEMLESLREISTAENRRRMAEIARAAIAKATGEKA